MSKAVLISIRPEWCEKIVGGEKTIEVRKTRPKLEMPFKCYIYCTKDKKDTDRLWVLREQIRKEYNGIAAVCAHLRAQPDLHSVGNGYVVGEFTCNTVTNLFSNSRFWLNEDDVLQTCLSAAEIRKYAYGANGLYGWHISDLKIYDTPKELSEFKGLRKTRFGYAPVEIKRPPQSWCYVEELQ